MFKFLAMYLLQTLLLMFRSVIGHDIKPLICDGVVFDHQYYERQMLFGTLNAPTNLVMHKYTGEIFFSHTVQEGTKPDFVIRVCDIDKRICKDLREVAGGTAVAYDQVNDDVYFGGRDGIYKYNRTTQSAHFVAERGKQLWDMLINKYLYYIESSTKKLLVYKHGQFSPVLQFENVQMDNFFISRHHSVYFSNRTALYRCDRINKPAYPIFKSATIRQIVQRYKSNRVYFAASNGIYYLHDTNTHEIKFKKAADINQVFGMTFRNTTQSKYEPIQILYSDKHSIFKLTPSKQGDYCLKERKRQLVYMARQKIKEAKHKRKIERNGTVLGKSTTASVVPRAQRMMFAIA